MSDYMLTRRSLLAGGAGVATAALMPAALADAAQLTEAEALHRKILVLDAHADVLLPPSKSQYYHVPDSYLLPDRSSRIAVSRLVEGGVDAITLAVAVGPGPMDAAGISAARAEADAKLAVIRQIVADHPDRLSLALSAADVRRLYREGRTAIIIGFQNARMIGGDVDQLDEFYRAGARIFALNHAGHNAFSDSSRYLDGPAALHGGLSTIGRAAIGRLNDLGAVIDVSQTSTASFMQTLSLSRAPVIASHSNVDALAPSVRNLTDAQLDAIKANGGVVHVTPFAAFILALTADQKVEVGKMRARYGLSETFVYPSDDIGTLNSAARTGYIDDMGVLTETFAKPTVANYVDHIDYIVRRIGVAHVGIGTDFDHGSGIPGFNSASEAPNVTRELLARGYDEAAVAAIWGGNFLRAFEAAESAALSKRSAPRG